MKGETTRAAQVKSSHPAASGFCHRRKGVGAVRNVLWAQMPKFGSAPTFGYL